MTYFESLLLLLLMAIVLLQISKQLNIPYPALLVAAGVVVALIPGTPVIHLDPGTALALFIAPALVDATFDFPMRAARRYWIPLVIWAVFAVIVTTLVVAIIGVQLGTLPIAAAVVLGAIVSPPDAAATTATLGTISIPKSTDAVLKGESLFNDATALLLFSGALAIQMNGGIDSHIALGLGLAAPGGIAFGALTALFFRRINPLVAQSLRGSLLQFTVTFLVWIVAEHLQLSAVLSEVAYATVLANSAGIHASTRNRVHSYAVWGSVVFVLNVLAFLLMGMQSRLIFERSSPELLGQELRFAALVVLAVMVTRMLVIFGFNRLAALLYGRRGQESYASAQQGIFAGWAGMRGLVTLATAFALPETFPQRDLVVLSAFAVVIATLVIQGLTLAPLARLLGLDQTKVARQELTAARRQLAIAAMKTLEHETGPEAESLRVGYLAEFDAAQVPPKAYAIEQRQRLGLAAVTAERACLEQLRFEQKVDAAGFEMLQEDVDWRALSWLPEAERRMEKN